MDTKSALLSNPQKLDSVIRSITASVLALILVLGTIYLSIFGKGTLSAASAEAVKAAALIVVGFYFGGHVAQNTAALEEARQMLATKESAESAIRSEASAVRSAAFAKTEEK